MFAILILVLIALWIAAGTLASPARREIQPYHRSYLESPEAHGIKISRGWLDETPFLFVVPDLAMPLGERGKVLVRQLAEEDFGLSREVRGLVVLLHGRNGRKEDLLPVAKAETLRIPTLVIHGDEDELISEGRGRELYNSFAGPKRWLTVSGGNHDNVLVTEAPVYAEMVKWLLEADHSEIE